MKCPNKECGSTDIDWQEAGGDAVCVRCGAVCEESTIVSSIEFAEGSGGSSSVVGQFVSASCTKPYGGLGTPRSYGGRGANGGRPRYGFLRSSRETTLASGKRKIQQVASSLRLGSHYVDGAHRLFGMAAQRNFTQGRKTMHVVCACLYVMCRREKSAHMLIDFSDVLQTSVYALGSTFLKFRKLLNLELPIIDPSLYIHRFAAKLELGDKSAAVANTALRVVQRMRRDWIETGRRPAGVCAAALLVGSRAHGFYRTQDDVVRALRVCGETVSKRLQDFQRTPAAQLSLSSFSTHELDKLLPSEENPPAFVRAEEDRLRNKLLLTEKGHEDETTKQHEAEATIEWAPLVVTDSSGRTQSLEVGAPPAPRPHKAAKRNRERRAEKDKLYGEIRGMLEERHLEGDGANKTPTTLVVARPRILATAAPEPPLLDEDDVDDNGDKLLEEDDAALLEDAFEDVADAEIDGFILTDDEVKKKSAIWTQMNRDYLAQKDERDRLAAARAEAAGDDSATTANKRGGRNNNNNNSNNKKKGGRVKREHAATARAALLDVVERRKFSKKINYKALEGIFEDVRAEDEEEDDEEDDEEEDQAPAIKRARKVVGGPRVAAPAVRPAPAVVPAAPARAPSDAGAENTDIVDDFGADIEDDEEMVEEAEYGDYDEEYD